MNSVPNVFSFTIFLNEKLLFFDTLLLQKSKYEYYKELKEQKENLEIQLNKDQAKLKQFEEEIGNLKYTLQTKDNEINETEASMEAYLDEIRSLKKKNDEFRKEKSKLDAELNKKSKIINELKEQMDNLVGVTKEKEVNLDEVKKKASSLVIMLNLFVLVKSFVKLELSIF